MKYYIKKLSMDEMSDIYNNYLLVHFPKDEVKPLENIKRMWSQNHYKALAMYESGSEQLVGYAFLSFCESSSQLLLDYYAIIETHRGKGLGSYFLKEMKPQLMTYKGIIIETEDITNAKSKEEYTIRKKRDLFYERNGAQKTAIRSSIYGVKYVIWQLPVENELPISECCNNLREIYKMMVPGEKYEQHVKIYKN